MISLELYVVRQMSKLLLAIGFVLGIAFIAPHVAGAQATGSMHGQVLDPSGALVPDATLTLMEGKHVLTAHSGSDGTFTFEAVAAGSYTLTVNAEGFATFSKTNVLLRTGQVVDLKISLKIPVDEQSVAVSGQNAGVSVEAAENASAMVITGADLDALSDDPTELANQLQALAGPTAGPSGGQIYVDGFTGGQLPPKSSIREIRINQNPFSAEFDRLGYGRIEILTKPGTDKLTGYLRINIGDSALDTANPLVSQKPSYNYLFGSGGLNGPLTKTSSYNLNFSRLGIQNQAIVDAVNPTDTSSTLQQTVPNPSSILNVFSRLDLQLGNRNTLSVRDHYFRSVQTGAGVGALNLPEQAYKTDDQENTVQATDTVVVNSHLLNETGFQWRRIRNDQTPSYFTPTVTLQGAFTTGGSNNGITQDHQNLFELHNYFTATAGSHTMRFGTRLRAYQDANYSTSGVNGNYLFDSVSQYLANTPAQYQATVVEKPLARVLLFDAALFFQDDWRWKPNLTLSYGLRFEGQNRIHNHDDWAPRLALAWAPGHSGKTPAKTVLRAGYGWFYDRFTVPNSLTSATGTPYIIQAIHQNGINQQSYVINNPSFFNPNAPEPPSGLVGQSGSIPYVYSVDPHFHAELNMQGGVGVDQKIGKNATFNVTYLYTRGVHQYLTNNVTAPEFDPTTYALVGAPPSTYNYQFQSGGYFAEHQIIATTNAQYGHVSIHASYTFTEAKSDTQGVTSFPSDAQDPGLDYGRPSFGIRDRLFAVGTYSAPYGITFAALMVAQSGTPYNLTIGSDLTGNNQFNARPTYGTCGATGVVSTSYGCLDTDPTGKGEKIVPYGLGTGPANFELNLHLSKVIGIGPKIGGESGSGVMGGNGSVSGRGLSGSQAQQSLYASVKRKYSLTLNAFVGNVFNNVNLAPQNGTLLSPLFGKSQSLAGGEFAQPVPGNRVIFVGSAFSF
jgi:Carboxypeptidase regulatory-like domain